MNLEERLADYAHVAWSGWMDYLFKKSWHVFGFVIIPRSLVSRWTRQMNTPYEHLSEGEKESDRMEARTMIRIMKEEWTNGRKNNA